MLTERPDYLLVFFAGRCFAAGGCGGGGDKCGWCGGGSCCTGVRVC